MKRSRLGPTVLLLLPMLMSCGIAMDATPRDIPASQRLLPLENDVTAFESTGSSLIYLVSAGDDRSLKSVRRGGDTQADLLDILLAGPTEDESVAQPVLLSHQISKFCQHEVSVQSPTSTSPAQ